MCIDIVENFSYELPSYALGIKFYKLFILILYTKLYYRRYLAVCYGSESSKNKAEQWNILWN